MPILQRMMPCCQVPEAFLRVWLPHLGALSHSFFCNLTLLCLARPYGLLEDQHGRL